MIFKELASAFLVVSCIYVIVAVVNYAKGSYKHEYFVSYLQQENNTNNFYPGRTTLYTKRRIKIQNIYDVEQELIIKLGAENVIVTNYKQIGLKYDPTKQKNSTTFEAIKLKEYSAADKPGPRLY